MSSEERRTTPASLQVFGVLCVGHLAAYFVITFLYGFAGNYSLWVEGGRWSMFTHPATTANLIEGEALVDGHWQSFDPEELFPYRWGSGPRYARGAFFLSETRMTTLAASTCGRHPDNPQRVRYIRAVWDLQLGTIEPLGDTRRKELVDWDCTEVFELPGGRTLP